MKGREDKINEMLFVYRPYSEWHQRFDLTPGKIYTAKWNGEMVYSSDGTYYSLVNDLGTRIELHETHLVQLEKWRENKLNNIFDLL